MRPDKIKQLILELIKKTKNDELVWDSYTLPNNELPNGEYVLDKVYESKIENGYFNIYKYKIRNWYEEDEFAWNTTIKFELLDKNHHTDYEFPYDNSLDDLYSIIREQSSNVTDIVDNILGIKLKIIEAKFGTESNSIDVKPELAELISNNKINIIITNKLKGDPDPGKIKKLTVKYFYNNLQFEKEVEEGQRLSIP